MSISEGLLSKPKALNLGPRDGGTRIQRNCGDGGQCNCSSVLGYCCSYIKWVKKDKWFQSEPCDFLSPLAYINQDFCQFKEIKTQLRASLVAQWLRVCLLMQGTRVRALVWEDPTCRGAAGPVSHNY